MMLFDKFFSFFYLKLYYVLRIIYLFINFNKYFLFIETVIKLTNLYVKIYLFIVEILFVFSHYK